MEQAITWVVTGLIVGWLVRTAMKSERDFGVIGDLVTGSLGAVVGGWLVRQLDIVTPNNLTGHIVVSIFGAGVLLALARIARHAVGAGLSSSPQAAALVGELEEQILRLTTIERRVLSSMLRRGGPARSQPRVRPAAHRRSACRRSRRGLWRQLDIHRHLPDRHADLDGGQSR
jgi:uncharacterized membrane protein YeaQ/YmgE (transglycosylase-associated protein family)